MIWYYTIRCDFFNYLNRYLRLSDNLDLLYPLLSTDWLSRTKRSERKWSMLFIASWTICIMRFYISHFFFHWVVGERWKCYLCLTIIQSTIINYMQHMHFSKSCWMWYDMTSCRRFLESLFLIEWSHSFNNRHLNWEQFFEHTLFLFLSLDCNQIFFVFQFWTKLRDATR